MAYRGNKKAFLDAAMDKTKVASAPGAKLKKLGPGKNPNKQLKNNFGNKSKRAVD